MVPSPHSNEHCHPMCTPHAPLRWLWRSHTATRPMESLLTVHGNLHCKLLCAALTNDRKEDLPIHTVTLALLQVQRHSCTFHALPTEDACARGTSVNVVEELGQCKNLHSCYNPYTSCPVIPFLNPQSISISKDQPSPSDCSLSLQRFPYPFHPPPFSLLPPPSSLPLLSLIPLPHPPSSLHIDDRDRRIYTDTQRGGHLVHS